MQAPFFHPKIKDNHPPDSPHPAGYKGSYFYANYDGLLVRRPHINGRFRRRAYVLVSWGPDLDIDYLECRALGPDHTLPSFPRLGTRDLSQ